MPDAKEAKSIMFLPTKFNKSPNDEGDKLRHHAIVMMFFHLLFMILFEAWWYENFVVFPFMMEFLYIYCCFNIMMTLNKIFVFAYVGLMFAVIPLYFWLVIAEVGGFGSVLLCLILMTFYGYAGFFLTFMRFRFMNNAAPGWEPGSSGISSNEFKGKMLV